MRISIFFSVCALGIDDFSRVITYRPTPMAHKQFFLDILATVKGTIVPVLPAGKDKEPILI